MDAELTIELLKLIPSILWVVLVVVLIAVFYKPIMRELLPRVSGFKAFGVEVALVRQELDRAVEKQETEVSQSDRAQFLTRAQRVAPIVQGAQILWVDDNPDSNIYERRMLRSLGIFVDLARTSAEALSMLSQTQYDVVISDMNRDGVADEGLRFLTEMRQRGLLRWTIFYIGRVDPERGVPAYTFGITDRPDHLLHLVFDALERERG